MRTYQTLYRFRFLPEIGAWEKVILFPALVSGTTEQYTGTDSLDRNCTVVIRIVSDEMPDVSAGDVITFSDYNTPPADSRVTVLSVTDNRRGTKCVRHTKIVCR